MNGKKLRELRKEKGLTQQQLGDIVGVSHVMICRAEDGTKDPPLWMLKAMAKALGVKPGELLDD